MGRGVFMGLFYQNKQGNALPGSLDMRNVEARERSILHFPAVVLFSKTTGARAYSTLST